MLVADTVPDSDPLSLSACSRYAFNESMLVAAAVSVAASDPLDLCTVAAFAFCDSTPSSTCCWVYFSWSVATSNCTGCEEMIDPTPSSSFVLLSLFKAPIFGADFASFSRSEGNA